jgi:predicted nucleic acid-binding protein
MSRLVGVLDTATIIGLAKGEVFPLLAELYVSLSVPPGVSEEVLLKGDGRPGVPELEQALGLWISEITPEPHRLQSFPATLSQADREILTLAQIQGVDHVLSNDEGLIREASQHGLTCLRVTDLLLLLKSQGHVPAIRPVLDRMMQQDYAIRLDLYEEALRAAGEWPTP